MKWNLQSKYSLRLHQQHELCPWCGNHIGSEGNPEHIIPKSMGGTDAYENIAAAHRSCNAKRSSNIWLDPVAGTPFDFIRVRLKKIRDAEKYPDGLMILKR